MNSYLEKLNSSGYSSLIELIILKIILKKFPNSFNIEYYKNDKTEIGHWTLENGIEPPKKGKYLNNCFFDVTAWSLSKGKLDPDFLREKTIDYLFEVQNKSPPTIIDNLLMMRNYLKAGAIYYPKNPDEAGDLLDKCNGKQPYFRSTFAHPRGHASYPQLLISDKNKYKSVENYSMISSLATGFLTRDDQNLLFHLIMQTQIAENALNRLNNGENDVVFTINWEQLNQRIQVANWKLGKRVTDYHHPQGFTLLLAHHRESKDNKKAPVFVHTFYPILR